jgi:hypothetical protein
VVDREKVAPAVHSEKLDHWTISLRKIEIVAGDACLVETPRLYAAGAEIEQEVWSRRGQFVCARRNSIDAVKVSNEHYARTLCEDLGELDEGYDNS